MLGHISMDLVSSLNSTTERKIQIDKRWGVYKGVRKRSWGKWVSEIRIPKRGQRIWLGSYDEAEQAARAFDAACYCIRGEVGPFNFSDEKRPELPEGSGSSLSIKQIQTIAHEFGTSSGSMMPPSVYKKVVQESVEAPASPDLPVSSITGSACGSGPASLIKDTTSSLENLSLDELLLMDDDWIDEYY